MKLNFKKMFKKINLRGALKLASPILGAIPIGGGIAQSLLDGGIARAEQKKAEREAQAEAQAQLQQQADYQAMSNTEKLNAINNASQSIAVQKLAGRTNPNIGDILQGAGAGALQGAGSVLGGSQTAAQTGATLMNNTMTEWLKRHWWKVAGALAGVFFLIKFAVKPKRGYRR